MRSIRQAIIGLSVLLILFLIFCSWYKADRVSLSQSETYDKSVKIEKEKQQLVDVATVVKPEKSSFILFDIVKKGNKIEIGGEFYSEAQMKSFGENFERGGDIEYISTDFNKNRESNDALFLAKSIAPIFNNYFIDGRIRYQGDEVIIDGTLKNDKYKALLVKTLQEKGIPYKDNSQVLEKKDTSIKIIKSNNEIYKLDANLSSDNQKDKVMGLFKDLNISLKNTDTNVVVDKNLQSEQWDETVSKLFPIMVQEFEQGKIYYFNEKIMVEGVVKSEEARVKAEKVLKGSNIPYFLSLNVKEINSSSMENQASSTSKESKDKKSNSEQNLTSENENKDDKNNEKEREDVNSSEQNKTSVSNHNYEAIYQEMTPEQREISKRIEDNISALLKVENITFGTGSAKLTKKSKQIIHKIALILKEYPNVYIEIAGHTDNIGDSKANLDLSKRRVESVKAELVSLGIDAKRMNAVGYGETRPIVPNDTKEHRQQNRRVEFHIIKILEEGK